jgi:uncharacterized protein
VLDGGDGFRPAWWLPGAHAQTIGGRWLRSRQRVEVRRERLETPDGDFLDLELAGFHSLPADAPLALVLHGLEGTARSGYMLALFRHLEERGVRAVGMNFRSCGGEMNRLPRSYHAGETGDLDHVLGVVRQRYAGVPLAAAGFSLGGNMLLKYLGERAEAARGVLRAAVTVSVPFDLRAGAENLERGMGRVYTRYFMRKLLRKTRLKRELLAASCDMPRVQRARTLREFDDLLTAPLHGFRDAEEYYASSSSAGYLPRIRVPTLLLHAVDDPFLPPAAIPHRAIRDNPALTERFTRSGGHVGFVAGSPLTPLFWAEREAADFLAQRLRH